MIEQWRDVVGYEGLYQVSSDGRIKSMGRWVSNRGATKVYRMPRIKPAQFDNRGNTYVIGLFKDGKCKQRQIGQVVLDSFVSPRVGVARVVFKDGNRLNIHLLNLEWGEDSVTKPRLTAEQVEEIKQALYEGATTRTLAAKYKIAQSTICGIKHGYRYSLKSRSDKNGISNQPAQADHQASTG